jgi:hypothetical protein
MLLAHQEGWVVRETSAVDVRLWDLAFRAVIDHHVGASG